MSKYALYVKYAQYAQYVKYDQKKLHWYTKSSTWLCVLSSWKSVSRQIAHPCPPCPLRVRAWVFSPVPPPPPEKARRGWRRRRTRRQHRRRRLRRHRAHGSWRQALGRALRRRQRRGMPPRRWREDGPCRLHRRCRCHRCAHESRRLRRRLVRRRWGVGRRCGSRAAAPAAAHLERTAPPPPTLPERGGDPGGGEKKGAKPSLPRSPFLFRTVGAPCGLVPFAACMGHRDLACTRGESRLHKYLPQNCCAHNYLPQNTCHRAAASGAHSAERGEVTEGSMIGQLLAFAKTAR